MPRCFGASSSRNTGLFQCSWWASSKGAWAAHPGRCAEIGRCSGLAPDAPQGSAQVAEKAPGSCDPQAFDPCSPHPAPFPPTHTHTHTHTPPPTPRTHPRFKKAVEKGEIDEQEQKRQHARQSLERYMHYWQRWAENDSSRKKVGRGGRAASHTKALTPPHPQPAGAAAG